MAIDTVQFMIDGLTENIEEADANESAEILEAISNLDEDDLTIISADCPSCTVPFGTGTKLSIGIALFSIPLK